MRRTGSFRGSGAGSATRWRAGRKASTTRAPAADAAAATQEPAVTPSRNDCWTATVAPSGRVPATSSPAASYEALLQLLVDGLR